MNTGRDEDVKQLLKDLERETNPDTRISIQRAIGSIRNESSKIRDMRRALIKAHRDGNREEIKDIHEYVKGKQEYGQDKQL